MTFLSIEHTFVRIYK